MKPTNSKNLLIPILASLTLITIIAYGAIKISPLFATPINPKTNNPISFQADDDYYNIPDGVKYQSNIKSQKKGLITFSTETGHNYYLSGNDTNNTSFIYTEVTADNYIPTAQKRLPLNISLVIDRSGSMHGDKLNNVKEAAKLVIDKLSDNDYISIIVYESNVGVLQKSIAVKDKEALKQIISNITDDGGTNLGGGMLAGYEQVKSTYHNGYVNRVLLLSDGLANEGITDFNILTQTSKKWLNDEGISISTFGVGNDYNENLMTALAENGSGNYYYIKEANQMSSVIEKELNGLLSVVAQEAVLKYELPKDIIVTKVYGGNYEVDNNILIVKLKDIFANEKKSVLIKFKIKNTAQGELIFNTNLSYLDATNNNQACSLNNQNSIMPTSNNEIYLSNFSERVMQQCIVYESNDMMEKTLQEVDQKNFDKAKVSGNSNKDYYYMNSSKVSANEDMVKQEATIKKYDVSLQTIDQVSEEQLKIIQKESKSENYTVRKKK